MKYFHLSRIQTVSEVNHLEPGVNGEHEIGIVLISLRWPHRALKEISWAKKKIEQANLEGLTSASV